MKSNNLDLKKHSDQQLDLHIGWELANCEERKMLVRIMVQEGGCDVGTKRKVWVKINPDYEIG